MRVWSISALNHHLLLLIFQIRSDVRLLLYSPAGCAGLRELRRTKIKTSRHFRVRFSNATR